MYRWDGFIVMLGDLGHSVAVFQEVREGRSKVDSLTKKWYKEVRAAPSESEDEGGGSNVLEMEETSLMTPSSHH